MHYLSSRTLALSIAAITMLMAFAPYGAATEHETEPEPEPTPDTTAPSLVIDLDGILGNESYWRSAVDVSATCEDDESEIATFVASVDGGDAANVTGAIPVSGDGDHTVDFTCIDAAGNEASQGVEFRIDATAASGAVTVAELVLGDYRIGWSAADAGSGIKAVEVQMLMPNNEWRTFCDAEGEGAAELSGDCALPRYAGRRCHRVLVEDVAGSFGTSDNACTQTVPVTSERTELPATPCAVYGVDENGDQTADSLVVRTCGNAFVSDGSLARGETEETIIELP